MVQHDQLDVVPTQAFGSAKERAALYRQTAFALADELSKRVQSIEAAPKIAEAISALKTSLGSSIDDIQPDLLRMAWRNIAGISQAFGLLTAANELTPETVGKLFELSALVSDIQAFAVADLQANARAIQDLDLSPKQADEVRDALDRIATDVILSSGALTTSATVVMKLAAQASAAATNTTINVAIQSERLLILENTAQALALHLRDEPIVAMASTREVGTAVTVPAKRGRKGKGAVVAMGGNQPPSPPTRRGGDESDDSWSGRGERFSKAFWNDLPEEAGDAAKKSLLDAIRHSTKAAPALAGALAWALQSEPGLIAMGSGLSISVSWIAYELWKRSRKK